MKIEVGDMVKHRGERREVLSIHPDYGIDIGNMQRVSLDEIEEVYSVPVSGEITPGPWRWVFMGNAGNYYLMGNDGRGPAVRSGPKSADGQLMQSAPDLQAENERLWAACHDAHIQMIAMGNELNWDGVSQKYVDAINGIRAALAGGSDGTE